MTDQRPLFAVSDDGDTNAALIAQMGAELKAINETLASLKKNGNGKNGGLYISGWWATLLGVLAAALIVGFSATLLAIRDASMRHADREDVNSRLQTLEQIHDLSRDDRP